MDRVDYFSTSDQALSLIEGRYQRFKFQRHYHLDYHFGLILEGQQRFVYQGSRYLAGPGDLVLMPPDELHDGHSFSESGYRSQVFVLEPSWLINQLDAHSSTCLSFTHPLIRDPQVFSHLCQAHHALRQGNLSQLAQDCLPYETFGPLIDRYSHEKSSEPKHLGSQTLATLRDYLMAHLSESIHLWQLANMCSLSPTQFQRHFKATFGLTPYAWLTRLRLEQAMKLLKAGVLGTDVAHQVGFYDQAHFSKAFKQCFGVSPSQIR